MAANKNFSLLFTGASGYIGGSILHQLQHSKLEQVKNLKISVLVRNETLAVAYEKQGLKVYRFESLDQSDVLQKVAKEHDIVIHTASGYHTSSAIALIKGLGERKKETGQNVYYIHTTGTSNLGDHCITKPSTEIRIFSDKDDIYSHELRLEAAEPYAQRTTDIAAVKTGIEQHVPTYLIMSPTIYGFGTGLGNKVSIQGPALIRDMLKHGHAAVIGEGKGIWNHVHIDDLADLYEIILNKILSGEKLPVGDKGIYFSENGEFSWWEFSDAIAQAGFKLGLIKQEHPQKISLEEGAKRLAGGNKQLAELAFASNSRTRTHLGRELGWTPKKTIEDLKQHLFEEVKFINQEKK